MNGMHMDELNRKVCGWLVRDGNAAVGGSFMWARTMGGECYCGNLLWQSCRTIFSLMTGCCTTFCAIVRVRGLHCRGG